MKKAMWLVLLVVVLVGCSSNVRFIQTDESFEPKAKPAGAEIAFHKGDIKRPYHVVGVIEAQLGKKARRPEIERPGGCRYHWMT